MAAEVSFHPLAAGDLDAIYDYIADDNPARAIAFVRRIRDRCNRLAQFPHQGTLRPDLGDGVRTLGFERRATLVFRSDDHAVLILRILYAGRLPEPIPSADGPSES